MRKALVQWFAGPKDIIATILVTTYCLTYLLVTIVPGLEFNELMSRQFERIILIVVGFYFGSKEGNKKCNYLDAVESH